jgi:flagellar protein FlbD
MIKLTRFNGSEFVVNVDLIKFLEQTPDTVVTLTSGEKMLVKEKTEEIVRRAVQYQRALRFFPEGA